MAKRTKKPPPNLTSTILAPPNAGRVKTVFPNTDECCHRWAANTQRDGRAGNVMFADGVIYSYGAHFPMARHVRLPDGRAAVPLRAAMPILKAIRDEKNLADDFKVDGFRLQGIDFRGRLVTVGCHIVTFDEILRLAKRHNL